MLRKYLGKYKTGSTASHTWFSGGKYKITDMEEFYEKYVAALHSSEELEIVEMQLRRGGPL